MFVSRNEFSILIVRSDNCTCSNDC